MFNAKHITRKEAEERNVFNWQNPTEIFNDKVVWYCSFCNHEIIDNNLEECPNCQKEIIWYG